MNGMARGWTVVLAVAILATGCGGERRRQKKEAEQAAKEFQKMAETMQKELAGAAERANKGDAKPSRGEAAAPKDMAEAMQAMQRAMSGGENAPAVQLVEFRELKAMLPAELPKLKRTSATGERNAVMGINISQAAGRYEGENDAALDIEIQDMGGMRGIAMMAQFGWAAADVDRETDTGYERTVKIGKDKGFEEYDTQNRSGALKVLVAGRFMVEVRGRQMDMADIKAAYEKLPIADLAAKAK